jgi:hypothetical protein
VIERELLLRRYVDSPETVTFAMDFHSLRHWFITGLARVGVSPKMAQTLARHFDVRLTLGVCTPVELPDRSAAIESLPAPPKPKERDGADAGKSEAA